MHKPDQELFLLYTCFILRMVVFSLEEDGELTHVILYDMTHDFVQIPDISFHHEIIVILVNLYCHVFCTYTHMTQLLRDIW